MEFNAKLYGGHRGARYVYVLPCLPGIMCANSTANRKFWREMLPRMKYRNPSISMTVSRHNDPDGPSLLHIYTNNKASTQISGDETVCPSPTPPSPNLT